MGQDVGGGFAVNLDGLDKMVDCSKHGAEDMHVLLNKLNMTSSVGEGQLGDTGAVDAIHSFLVAWIDEVSIVAGGLDELGEKFADSVKNYSGNEMKWSDEFQGLLK